MKLIALLTICLLLFYTSKAEKEDFTSVNPKSQCYQFLLNLTNSSIPPANYTLETNNTLRYSGHNLNDLGDYNSCKNLLTQKYHIIGNLKSAATVVFGFCGPSFCSTKELQNISDIVIETIQNLTRKDYSQYNLTILDPQNLNIEAGFFFYFASLVIGALAVLVLVGTVSSNWSKTEKEVLQGSVLDVNRESLREDIKGHQQSTVFEGSLPSLQEALLANRETINEVMSNETVNVYLKKDSSSRQNYSTKHQKEEDSFFSRIIECFDLNENIKAFVSNEIDPKHDGNLNIFHGIRALCFGWVVCGHTLSSFITAKNYAYLAMFIKSWWVLILAGGLYAVDTFFYLSGFFTGFLLVSKLKNMPFGLKSYLKIFFHRWIRLWPSYFVSILFLWKIGVYYGNGAMWIGFIKQAEMCTTAWRNLLFVDNFISEKQNYCFGWGWYLANDIQMFLLSPFICWIYLKNKEKGKNLIWILIFISFVASYYESVNTGTTYILTKKMKGDHPGDYMFDYYANSVVRMSPYMLGILLGFMFREYKNGENNIFTTLKNSQSKSLISAVLGFVLILLLVFYPRTVQTGAQWTDGFAMTWNISARTLFAVGLFMLTAPGLVGNLKPFTHFMSNYYFTLVSRLSYTGYLIHYVFLFVVVYDSDQVLGINPGFSFSLAFSVFIFSCFGAFVIHLLVEKPFVNIETRIISGKKQIKAIINSNLAKKV